jgi:hypothetical protein
MAMSFCIEQRIFVREVSLELCHPDQVAEKAGKSQSVGVHSIHSPICLSGYNQRPTVGVEFSNNIRYSSNDMAERLDRCIDSIAQPVFSGKRSFWRHKRATCRPFDVG